MDSKGTLAEMQNDECGSTAFGSEAQARRELAEVRMQNKEPRTEGTPVVSGAFAETINEE
jgi:hypothetical protein